MQKNIKTPSEEKLSRSKQLKNIIYQEIKANGGFISFAKYMQLALYHPQLGYYTADLEKFGREGDFITAPTVSPLFGKCIARAIKPTLELTKSNNQIVEIGPGDGSLACQILTELAAQDALPNKYYCLEISPSLRKRQQETIQRRCPKQAHLVQWIDNLDNKKINGAVIANEVVDALPVEIFTWENDKLLQNMVNASKDENNLVNFHWQLQAANDEVSESCKDIIDIIKKNNIKKYTTEININAKQWVKNIAEHLQQGIVLCIDYGYPQHEYYHPQRNSGTLMCHLEHQAHDNPFMYPGIEDITAHVDFTALALAAHESGLNVDAYTSQAQFLINCDITDSITKLTDPLKQFQESKKLQRLLSPNAMGELFKVITFSNKLKDTTADVTKNKIFTHGDRRHELMGYK
jgi:SAM-dependent MidA family methyltransferase